MSLLRALTTIALLVLISIILWIVALWFSMIPFNNYKLSVIRRQFDHVNSSGIAQSRLLAEKSEVAHWGNSNLCDYYVGQFRASPLAKAEIEKAYENLTISSFKSDKNSPLKLGILFTDDEWFIDNSYYWYQWWQDHSGQLNIRPDENTYLAYAISDSYDALGDIRCH